MRTIDELNLLLRTRVELPEGIRLGTEAFREGWSFSRSLDVHRLEKRILSRGWNFIKKGDGPQGYGVGDTSQKAIASALKLALRRISEYFNAAEVARIQLTQYPWFFLARVGICQYRIQQGVAVPVPDKAGWLLSAPRRRRRSPCQSDEFYPLSGNTMPMLKEMLVSSEIAHEGTQ
ncbi:MAG: hypothetical protein WCF17_14720 [Terracidiphilus sp.]